MTNWVLYHDRIIDLLIEEVPEDVDADGVRRALLKRGFRESEVLPRDLEPEDDVTDLQVEIKNTRAQLSPPTYTWDELHTIGDE